MTLTISTVALGAIALHTIYRFGPVLANPGPFMERTGIQSREAVILIGTELHRPLYRRLLLSSLGVVFLLLLINGYDLIGASQDNWLIYWFSAFARAAASIVFYRLGPKWHSSAKNETVTLIVLLTSMTLDAFLLRS